MTDSFFAKIGEPRIVEAIRRAELRSRGEIRPLPADGARNRSGRALERNQPRLSSFTIALAASAGEAASMMGRPTTM